MKKLLVALLAVAFSAAPALADTYLVPNGSFEAAPNGAYTTTGSWEYVSAGTGAGYTTGANTTLVPNWTVTAIPQGGRYGLVNKNVFSPSLATTGDTQALFIQDYNNSGTGGILLSDSLGTIAANSTYTLSLNIGAPPTLTGISTYTAGYTAPQVYFALLGNGSNVITSMTLANTSVTIDGLTNYTISFTTGAAGGYIGQDLSIKLQAVKALYPANTVPGHSNGDPGGEVAIFDDVYLTGPAVPEPSTYALMLAGAGLMFLAHRRLVRR